MATETTLSDAEGDAYRPPPNRSNRATMATIDEGHRRIAYCECGAQLSGDSELDLFNAAHRHLAHRHPQLLGALEPGVVQGMAEDVPG
ncbi:MAG: hypothetical protein WBP81_35050 [Solirubrobacteraceae bacterium]